MNGLSVSLLSSLCLCVSVVSLSSAAPPAITSLHPAGAQRGTSVEVTAAGTFDASTKVWVSGAGVSVEPAKDKGKFRVTVAKDAVPGTYWLRAHNDDGASGLRPFIVGTLPDVAEKEPNDDFKKPQVVAEPAVVNGKLEKNGDVDCFAVPLKKGQTLVASLEAHNTLRSPMDAMLQVLSADGFVLEENNDFHGLDPQIVFTAKSDGTYIVRVYAFPSQPDASIRYFGSDACVYRLTLTTGPFADYAMPLSVGPNRASVSLEGWNLKQGPQAIIPTRVPGETHTTVFDPGIANSLRLRVEPHSVAVFDPDDRKFLLPPPPFSVSSRIEKKGGVNIPFRGKKGQALSLQVESRSLGLAVNPWVSVLNSDGKQVAKAEPAKLNGDTTLTFTPPADGTYSILVSDLYDGSGPRHAFLLRVLTEPDYELSVAVDRFTITPGKPTPVPVKVNRLRGFTAPVEVTAEGLPDDVKVEVTTPAKPDPNTITLALSAEKPWTGPFRLVGKVKDEPKLTRTARAALAEFDETTADLWLTVTPPVKK
jgi:hypothetical protein